MPLPREWTFVVGVSGVAADKTGNAKESYNRASLAARAVKELWNEATGRADATLAEAAAAGPDAADRIRDVLRYRQHPDFPPELLRDRFDQFFEESERIVPAAAEALARADASALGPLVDASQDRAERLLGNQIPETVTLARSARNLGAIAASAFGGGFGGSVWALVSAARGGGLSRRLGSGLPRALSLRRRVQRRSSSPAPARDGSKFADADLRRRILPGLHVPFELPGRGVVLGQLLLESSTPGSSRSACRRTSGSCRENRAASCRPVSTSSFWRARNCRAPIM